MLSVELFQIGALNIEISKLQLFTEFYESGTLWKSGRGVTYIDGSCSVDHIGCSLVFLLADDPFYFVYSSSFMPRKELCTFALFKV